MKQNNSMLLFAEISKSSKIGYLLEKTTRQMRKKIYNLPVSFPWILKTVSVEQRLDHECSRIIIKISYLHCFTINIIQIHYHPEMVN